MATMVTTKDIKISFYELNKILEKLNSAYTMINEKYGEDEAKLFEAGFWDKLKTGASKVGSSIGKAAGSVTNLGNQAIDTAKQGIDSVKQGVNKAYQKGMELGNQALDSIKNIAGKVSDYFSQVWTSIVNAPEAFWNKMKEGWDTVADQFIKMKETAGDKFQLNVGLILQDLNKKLCRKLRELTGDMQMGPYAIARKRPDAFKGKYLKFKGTLQAVAQELIKSQYNDAKEFGQKLLNSLKEGAADVGIFILGLIIAPFYIAGWAGKKLFNLGLDFGKSVEGFIKTAKQEVPQIWGEFKTGVKTGYQEKTNPNEHKILKFKEFVNEKKKIEEKEEEKKK